MVVVVGNGQRERPTLEFCFTRNYGNKMRMGAHGPTWWAHAGAHVGEEHFGVSYT
jgi:hypothetical protein